MTAYVLAIIGITYFGVKLVFQYPLGWHDKIALFCGGLIVLLAGFSAGKFIIAGGDHPIVDSAAFYLSVMTIVGLVLGFIDLISGAADRRNAQWIWARAARKAVGIKVEPAFAEEQKRPAAR